MDTSVTSGVLHLSEGIFEAERPAYDAALKYIEGVLIKRLASVSINPHMLMICV